MIPPAHYNLWWRVAEACSELEGDYAGVQWFYVPEAETFPAGHELAGGAWYPDSHRIVLAESELSNGRLVRHEILHALVGDVLAHPPLYFRDRCGGTVSCDGPQCQSEAGPLPEPDVAQDIAIEDLAMSTALMPDTISGSAPESWIVVTVSVTNQSDEAVSVELSSAPNGSALGFGFTVGSIGQLVPGENARLVLRAGETRRYSFDNRIEGSTFAPGQYAVRGRFNTRVMDGPTLIVTP